MHPSINRTHKYNKGSVMKRALVPLIMILLMLMFTFVSSAKEYEFELNDKDLSIDDDLSVFFDSLPDDIKNRIEPIDEMNSAEISQKYSFKYFLGILKEKTVELLPNILKSLTTMMGMIVVVSIPKKIQSSLRLRSLSPAFNMCSSLVFVLAAVDMQKNILTEAEIFLSTLSETMLLIVPVMEAICLTMGNFNVMSVTSTGLNLMISFTVNLFTKAIFPSLTVSFIVTAFSTVTRNKSISYLSKCLRTVITTVVIITMTLMSFSLTLQTQASTATDNFTNRTIRFALGNYIPIVGGTVSETYSLVHNSIAVIKSLTGTTAIVILILICLKPIVSISLWRVVMSICKNLSGIFGCDNEELLFEEFGSSYTLLLAVVISCSIMYIIALAQFCKTSAIS